MTRGEVGARPLLIDIIKRVISYRKNINERREIIVYSACEFELKNDSEPNLKYINNFNISDGNEILEKKKNIIKEICQDNYDRCWCTMLVESLKANSYIKFKNRISLEKYLSSIQNVRHRIALTRFRLSNHNLLIEKGRHFRPKLERHDRKYFICKDNVEDENHFIMNCPLYSNQRFPLNRLFKNNRFFQLFNVEQKFIFIMIIENEDVMVELATFFLVQQK